MFLRRGPVSLFTSRTAHLVLVHEEEAGNTLHIHVNNVT